ncbi:MAG TPA: hypothetical protein VLD86_09435 [Ilumatobacteraceae bacterium]|nr:hypothetical protein [Ilumatobacteraceae bacterium]
MLSGEGKRIRQVLDAELTSVGADEADLAGADAIVVPVLGLLRRCYG